MEAGPGRREFWGEMLVFQPVLPTLALFGHTGTSPTEWALPGGGSLRVEGSQESVYFLFSENWNYLLISGKRN